MYGQIELQSAHPIKPVFVRTPRMSDGLRAFGDDEELWPAGTLEPPGEELIETAAAAHLGDPILPGKSPIGSGIIGIIRAGPVHAPRTTDRA